MLRIVKTLNPIVITEKQRIRYLFALSCQYPKFNKTELDNMLKLELRHDPDGFFNFLDILNEIEHPWTFMDMRDHVLHLPN